MFKARFSVYHLGAPGSLGRVICSAASIYTAVNLPPLVTRGYKQLPRLPLFSTVLHCVTLCYTVLRGSSPRASGFSIHTQRWPSACPCFVNLFRKYVTLSYTVLRGIPPRIAGFSKHTQRRPSACPCLVNMFRKNCYFRMLAGVTGLIPLLIFSVHLLQPGQLLVQDS